VHCCISFVAFQDTGEHFVVSIVSAVVAMVITVYVPIAGGVNGGAITRSGATPVTGMAACGWKYPFGTVFEVINEDMSKWGLPQVVVCMDRGGFIGPNKLDLVLVSTDVKGDLNRAKQWGKRTRDVRIYPNLAAYEQAKGLDPSHFNSDSICRLPSKCTMQPTAR
jgi:hypothetical protein